MGCHAERVTRPRYQILAAAALLARYEISGRRTAFVSYGQRLLAAAEQLNLPVGGPGA